MKAKGLLIIGIIFVSLFSCIGEDRTNNQLNAEVKQIDDYLAGAGITENLLYDNANGSRIHVHEYGKLAPPHEGQEVTINYVGKLFSNGATFASGVITDKVQNLNPIGFRSAVMSMMTGSNVTAYIPSRSGFGAAGANGVPPDAILVYDIYIANTERTPTENAQFKKDSTAIANYIADNQFNYQYSDGDIWYVIDEAGVGIAPNPFDVISGDYKLSLMTDPGTIVEEASLTLSPIWRLVDGLRVSIPLLRKGTRAQILVPSVLGYGPTGYGNVPGNANLIFEFTLTDIHR